jgi:hypothetical protein
MLDPWSEGRLPSASTNPHGRPAREMDSFEMETTMFRRQIEGRARLMLSRIKWAMAFETQPTPSVFKGLLFPKRTVHCLIVPRLYVSADSLDALDATIPELLSLKHVNSRLVPFSTGAH